MKRYMNHWLIHAFIDRKRDLSQRYYHVAARAAQSAKNKVVRAFNKSFEHYSCGYQIRVYHVELVTEERARELAREIEQQRHILSEMREAVKQQERLIDRLKSERHALEHLNDIRHL